MTESYVPEQPIDGSWERQRRTGRFEVTPYTEEQADASVAALGLPPRLPGETWSDWSQRVDTTAELRKIDEEQGVNDGAS